MDSDVSALSQLYLFRSVPPAALQELCSLAPPASYPTGATVFRQGDPSDHALLVVSGRLQAFIHTGDFQRQVGEVRSGEIVGEGALFNPTGARSATVVAVEPSATLQLDWGLLERSPNNAAVIALEQYLLGTIARRIRKTNQSILAEWRAEAMLEQSAPAEAPTLKERILRLLGWS